MKATRLTDINHLEIWIEVFLELRRGLNYCMLVTATTFLIKKVLTKILKLA